MRGKEKESERIKRVEHFDFSIEKERRDYVDEIKIINAVCFEKEKAALTLHARNVEAIERQKRELLDAGKHENEEYLLQKKRHDEHVAEEKSLRTAMAAESDKRFKAMQAELRKEMLAKQQDWLRSEAEQNTVFSEDMKEALTIHLY